MTRISVKIPAALAALLLSFGTGLAQAAVTTIDFEGTGAPCCFVSSNPLSNLYAAQGISFSGVGGLGGSILNQGGNFGFNARSGTDFLAFNLGMTSNIEQISFATQVSRVSIWAASASQGTITMRAYDSQQQLLASHSIASAASWQELSVNASNIASVQLIGPGYSYAYDDLSISAVPEAESYALMLAGLAALGWRVRKRATKLA